jgi:prepilin-type N-terminal cleavage/methylation domain-containing protein
MRVRAVNAKRTPSRRGAGRPARAGRLAFTLVEVIVGSVILALVAAATAASLAGLVRSSDASAAAAEAHQRADRATAMIAADAVSLARRSDLRFARLRILDGGEQDDLLMLVRSRRPLRDVDFAAEGGEYEVQYRMGAAAAGSGPALWRRRDVAFDDVPDGGGIAAEVAAGVIGFNVEAGDGANWYSAWDTDLYGLPHLLRVTVTAASDDGRRTSVARRVVAFDRVPIPLETDEESSAAENAEGAS